MEVSHDLSIEGRGSRMGSRQRAQGQRGGECGPAAQRGEVGSEEVL